MDKEMKRFLQEELKKEAGQIMSEVENDPDVKDVEASPDMREKLFAQIRQYEEEQEQNQKEKDASGNTYENLPEEYKELIDLGRVYKRRRKNRKYLVLAAAIVLAMACGVTSIGGPERLFKEIQWAIGGREQVNVDSDGERVVAPKEGGEDAAYQAIRDELGFEAVRMHYLPKEIWFAEAIIDKDLRMAQFIYGGENKKILSYQMNVNYRQGSVGFDVEDELVDEYTLYQDKISIEVKEYSIKDTGEEKWNIRFKHKGIQYLMTIQNMNKGEIEKILKNLYFL